MKNDEWQKYITPSGDFEFPKYLYKVMTDLMKSSLDLGTLVCKNQNELRAFKERTKAAHKQKWIEIASALEFFGIVSPCVCKENEYCSVCGGSRFLISDTLTADEMRQVAFAVDAGAKADIMTKLQVGLSKALDELDTIQKKAATYNG